MPATPTHSMSELPSAAHHRRTPDNRGFPTRSSEMFGDLCQGIYPMCCTPLRRTMATKDPDRRARSDTQETCDRAQRDARRSDNPVIAQLQYRVSRHGASELRAEAGRARLARKLRCTPTDSRDVTPMTLLTEWFTRTRTSCRRRLCKRRAAPERPDAASRRATLDHRAAHVYETAAERSPNPKALGDHPTPSPSTPSNPHDPNGQPTLTPGRRRPVADHGSVSRTKR